MIEVKELPRISLRDKICKWNGNEIVVAQDVCTKIAELNYYAKEMEKLKKEVSMALTSAMEEYGVLSIDNEYFSATYVKPSVREGVDTAELKVLYPDVYKAVRKETEVSSSVRIKVK